MTKPGLLVAVVGGLVVVGLIGFAASRAAKPQITPNKPTKPTKPTGTTTKPKGTPGKENKAETLTKDEALSLADDSLDMLAAWGMVSPHKIYVKAIADKLAGAGDIRAADVNARVGAWSGVVVYAGLIDPEADMVANPGDYTLDQIGEQGLASDFPAFKQWAAQFMRANKRTEQAQLILDQIEANKRVNA